MKSDEVTATVTLKSTCFMVNSCEVPVDDTVKAMAITYNWLFLWLFLWDYTFYVYGVTSIRTYNWYNSGLETVISSRIAAGRRWEVLRAPS
jgi:hypothetical protein